MFHFIGRFDERLRALRQFSCSSVDDDGNEMAIDEQVDVLCSFRLNCRRIHHLLTTSVKKARDETMAQRNALFCFCTGKEHKRTPFHSAENEFDDCKRQTPASPERDWRTKKKRKKIRKSWKNGQTEKRNEWKSTKHSSVWRQREWSTRFYRSHNSKNQSV